MHRRLAVRLGLPQPLAVEEFFRVLETFEQMLQQNDLLAFAEKNRARLTPAFFALFAPGTETGKGWHDTTVKPELFKPGSKVGEYASAFSKEANELAQVALLGHLDAARPDPMGWGLHGAPG